MSIIEELSCDGVRPTGPVSGWPKERHDALLSGPMGPYGNSKPRKTKVDASLGKMAQGFMKTAGQALTSGKVSAEIREERYDTCKSCPFFVEDSKRCSDCGCYMEAKTWVGGDPKNLCPQNKWSR